MKSDVDAATGAAAPSLAQEYKDLMDAYGILYKLAAQRFHEVGWWDPAGHLLARSAAHCSIAAASVLTSPPPAPVARTLVDCWEAVGEAFARDAARRRWWQIWKEAEPATARPAPEAASNKK